MCGIIGVFDNDHASELVLDGMSILKNRGKDAFGICSENKTNIEKDLNRLKGIKSRNIAGHCLHSVVNFVPQPLTDKARKARFVFNGEIYNWLEIASRYKITAKNDSELIFLLIKKQSIGKLKQTLNELQGVYALAYWQDDNVYIARDIIGVKPVWFSHTKGFAFASERKVLEKMDFFENQELNPRKILRYNIKTDKLTLFDRPFFKTAPENKSAYDKIKKELTGLIIHAIAQRIPDKEFGILFSGGIDSTIIAMLCRQIGLDPVCYTAVLDEPGMGIAEDLISAKRVAKELKLRHKIVKLRINDIPDYLKKIVPLIEDTNVVKVGVGLTFFAACQAAKKDRLKVIFSGLGSEEIFAGYERHKKSLEINKECLSGVLKLYERDTYRDDQITMYHDIELRVPFMDKRLVEFSLKIPARFKLNEENSKLILRDIAKDLGLKPEFAMRKKRAAQYGSKFDRAIEKLAKRAGFRYKSDYLQQFYKTHNLRLGALISSGKDSIYAMHVMQRQNYKIACLITIKSENPDSYMFHTPAIDLVDLQESCLEIPLITEYTKGEKEKELEDLKNALIRAKKEFKIDGIITGALFSDYQRERIEKAADSAGLKIFSPLWHMNQETEMRQLINEGFEVMMSSIAAEGLDKSWLGRILTENDVNKLVALNEKIGLNIAGEGGEFETLVLNAPMFKKRIKITSFDISSEADNTARMIIKKAKLIEKTQQAL